MSGYWIGGLERAQRRSSLIGGMHEYFRCWLILLAIGLCIAQDELASSCRMVSSSQSCSQCIQKSNQCAWCGDPGFLADFRCDSAKNFQGSCSPQYLFQDISHAQVTEDVSAGSYDTQRGKIRQIEPQQVHILVRPGESVTFPLKYYHADAAEKDIHILNSLTEPQGITISYSIDCKGVHAQDQTCRNVRNAEMVNANVSVSIRDCDTDTVVSIGIGGVQEVIALYVRSQCGCDCEKADDQENGSGHCGGQGTLICGACHCDEGKGGRRCECDLPSGVTSEELDGQCREAPDRTICSGHGYCACGQCVCENPNLYSGRFCECGKTECPRNANGAECNGRGTCQCGKCECESGWSGGSCDCSSAKDACFAADGSLCSSRGSCTCNKCKCDQGSDGDRCETSTTAPDEDEDDGRETDEPSVDNAGDPTAAPSAAVDDPTTESPDASNDDNDVPPTAEQASEPSTSRAAETVRAYRISVLGVVFAIGLRNMLNV